MPTGSKRLNTASQKKAATCGFFYVPLVGVDISDWADNSLNFVSIQYVLGAKGQLSGLLL
jgi:hypothetical protein